MDIVKNKDSKRLLTPSRKTVLKKLLEFHSASGDFNGLPYYKLIREIEPGDELLETLASLIRDKKVVAVFGDIHPNPHILALTPSDPEELIGKLRSTLSDNTCFYPSETALAKFVQESSYIDRPFTLRLALGKPHLEPCFFDLSVLERYRNDPRYVYWVSDSHGNISVMGTPENPSSLRTSDQVLLKTFGFGHDREGSCRVVVVYLRYLSRLTSEHQKIWRTYLLDGEFYVHPSYQAITKGEWIDEIGVFDAIKEELICINDMCKLIGKPNLFSEDFRQLNLPKHFTFLLRPTLKEFHDFLMDLEKIVVENINRKFFVNDISFESETIRSDGKVEVKQKGTIQLLEDWLHIYYRTSEPCRLHELMKIPRKIRKLRQAPAHKLNDDCFDKALFKDQRDLITEAYFFVQCLRIALNNHPMARDYEIPEMLVQGKIFNF